MFKDVVKIIQRHEMLIVGALLLPLAAIEVVTLITFRMFFLTLNSVAAPDATLKMDAYLPTGIGPIGTAMIAGFGLVLWLLIRSGLSQLIWVTIIGTITTVQARVLDQLFHRFISLPMKERLSGTLSEQKHILLLSAQSMFHQVFFPLSKVLVEAVITIAIVLTLLVIEPIATILIVVWICLFFGVYFLWLSPKFTIAGRERWQSLHAMRLVMDGALGDLRWVKITRGEGLFRRVFGAKSSAYTDALAKDRALTLISGYAADMAIVSSILVLFTYFMTLGGGSDTLFASFALFAAAALRLFPALYRVISLSHSLSTHAPDLGQVVENLKGTLPPLEVEILNAPQNPPFHESLAFQDVSFRYPGQNRNILSDVNLILNAGDRVVIGGASGSGKSTLLSIILGLLNPDEGRVLLDGTETPVLNAIRNASVALVSQDPFISTGTVGDNIAFPHPAASLDIEKAQTLLVALGLDWSLDRQVGENGIHLSGGERQRLALTRALYLSPMFLVLDEATSQMDEVTACRAYELVFETCPNATVLLCTHQKHPNAFCSRHLKVEAGVINDLSL